MFKFLPHIFIILGLAGVVVIFARKVSAVAKQKIPAKNARPAKAGAKEVSQASKKFARFKPVFAKIKPVLLKFGQLSLTYLKKINFKKLTQLRFKRLKKTASTMANPQVPGAASLPTNPLSSRAPANPLDGAPSATPTPNSEATASPSSNPAPAKKSPFAFLQNRRKSKESVPGSTSSQASSIPTDPANKVIDLLEQASNLFGSGQYPEAEKTYIEIIKLDPRNFRAYKGLGKIYVRQNNTPDAVASFEQALKLSPGDEEAVEELKKLKISTSI